MPNKATITGTLVDADLAPVSGGKIVAVLAGSDYFDGGVRIVSQKVEATTDASGSYTLNLVVNGEGETGATAWDITGFNAFVEKVFEAKGLFIATALPATMAEIERTSVANKPSAKDTSLGRLIHVDTMAEYAALPASQRRDTDIVLVREA